jgi:hypothetical protein
VSHYYLLLFVRFCFGAGEAGAYPNAAAVIGRWIPAARRTRGDGEDLASPLRYIGMLPRDKAGKSRPFRAAALECQKYLPNEDKEPRLQNFPPP